MERRTKLGIAIIAVITLLAGMVLGGLAGGGFGYYLARRQQHRPVDWRIRRRQPMLQRTRLRTDSRPPSRTPT